MRRIAIALCLFGYCGTGLCQIPAMQPAFPDATQYESLFRRVAVVPGSPQEPAIPETIGLTEDEKNRLRAVATDFEAQNRALRTASGRLVLEARFRFIESGESTEGLEDRLKAFEGKRGQITSDSIQLLKNSLGESGFEKVGAYLRALQDAPKPHALLLNGEPQPEILKPQQKK